MLRGLGSITATANMCDLAVLGEPRPLWAGSADWPDTLMQLMARRVAVFGDQLRAVVDDFDAKYARIVGLLQGVGDRPLTVSARGPVWRQHLG